MKRNARFYLKLFISVFTLSAFTVGGGYVIVPLMKKKFVDKLGWVDEEEMLDMVAIAQSSPGAMAINTAILTGYRTGGAAGAIVGTLGSLIPPLIIITVIFFAYDAFKTNRAAAAVLAGVKIGVAAVIVDVVINMITAVFKSKSLVCLLVLLVSFILTVFVKVNVIYILLGVIAFGLLYTLAVTGKNKKEGGRL